MYSDHRPIATRLSFKLAFTASIHEYSFIKSPERFKWSEESSVAFRDALKTNNVDTTLRYIADISINNRESQSIELNDKFINSVIAASELSLAKTNSSKRTSRKKWFNKQCAVAKRNLQKSIRRMNKCVENKHLRDEYFKARRTYKNLLINSKLNYQANLNRDIENGKIIDWKNFKILKQSFDDPEKFDSHDLAAFYEFFKGLYENATNNFTSSINTNLNIINNDDLNQSLEELNEYISPDEISNAVHNLRNAKGVSEDLISNEMLKNLNNVGMRALSNVFNNCLLSGTYPWNNSIISPIHKSGDRYNPDNYRAIAVSSCIGKLFSTILLNRLVTFRKHHCPDPINQLGFCKNSQTNDHIFTLKTIIDKYRKNKHKKLFACFVDLKKAFDTVSRPLLLQKIVNLGVKGNFSRVLKNMYDNSLAKIKLDKLLSPNLNINK